MNPAPAFPLPITCTPEGVIYDTEEYCNTNLGITIRDYFAAAALPAVCHDWCSSDPKHAEEAARVAYEFADAMMEKRNNET